MPRPKQEETTEKVTIRMDRQLVERIQNAAAGRKITFSRAVRELLVDGLKYQGYLLDEGRQYEMIQAAVKSTLDPAVERLAAISAKGVQINGAAFFMLLYQLKSTLPPTSHAAIDDAAEQARMLGIQYLKQKDQNIDKFLKSGSRKMTEE